MEQALFDAAAARIKDLFNHELDRDLPEWARRSNPIVRRHLGSYWKTLTPDLSLVAKLYLAQVGIILISFVFPVTFTLMMPTVTVTLVMLPIGIGLYLQLLYYIGSATATWVVQERQNQTLDLLLIIPRPPLHIIYSKIAAAIWHNTENLSLILMGTVLASFPLLVIQYSIYFSINTDAVLMRVGMALALGAAIVRLLLEPVMIGALGAVIGAAIPARIPAIVTTTVLGGAYFLMINLLRLAPLDDGERILVEIVLPVVLPILITFCATRAAAHLLTRD